MLSDCFIRQFRIATLSWRQNDVWLVFGLFMVMNSRLSSTLSRLFPSQNLSTTHKKCELFLTYYECAFFYIHLPQCFCIDLILSPSSEILNRLWNTVMILMTSWNYLSCDKSVQRSLFNNQNHIDIIILHKIILHCIYKASAVLIRTLRTVETVTINLSPEVIEAV